MFIEKLISVLIMIFIFYMSIQSITDFAKIDYDRLLLVLKEFDMGYIEDIQVKEIPATCDINYSPIDFEFNYPGNYKGCQCVNPTNKSKIETFSSSCPEHKDNCIFFKERVPQKIIYWKKKLICIKRSSLQFRHIQIQNISTGKCDENLKNCGKIDTLGNYICLPKNLTCPVSNLKILSDVNEINIFNKTVDNKTAFLHHLSDNSYLQYNIKDVESDAVGNIIPPTIYSFFKAGLSNPCLYSDRFPKGDLIFDLEKNYINYGCIFDAGIIYNDTVDSMDNRFKTIDKYSLGKLYSDNGLKDLILDLSTIFPEIPNKDIRFTGREFLGWNNDCRMFENGLHSFLNSENLLNTIVLMNTTHCFIMILFLLAIAISSCFFTKYFEILFRIISILFCVLNLVYPIQIISKTNYVVNTLTNENEEFCSDHSTNIVLKMISSACSELNYAYIKCLLLTILYTLIIIYGLYKWIQPYHEQYQDTYKKYIDRK